MGDQQRAFLAASDDKATSVSVPFFQQAMPQHMQAAPKFALQGMRAFKGLMMEFQMHETIPRGGVFKIR